MKTLILFLIVTLCPINALAYEVKYLEKDTPAPFSGFLFSKESEKQLREMEQDLALCNKASALYVKQSEAQEELFKLAQRKASLYETQSDRLAKELADQRSTTFWQNTAYFIGGALLSGIIAYGYSRVLR